MRRNLSYECGDDYRALTKVAERLEEPERITKNPLTELVMILHTQIVDSVMQLVRSLDLMGASRALLCVQGQISADVST